MHDRHTESDRFPQFRLLTLGDARLVRLDAEGVTLDVLGPNKALALLTYLACSPRRTASREHLLDFLWADLTPDQGRHALRQAVWYLRQRLGTEGLVTDNGDLVLTARLVADRDEFLEAVDLAELERAVGLYRGDFLPGFAAPGSADFEHWVDAERYRLRLVFLRTAEVVVRRWLSMARFRDAKILARRIREAEPGSESGWRLLLESLAASRDDIALATETEQLRRMLEAERRMPEPATRALLDVVRERADVDGRQTERGLVAELVGRQDQFSRLVTAWHGVERGLAQHIHIAAPAGLGKTRLLADLHARLRASGASALYVRANPGDRHLPFGSAAEVAAALCTLPGAVGVAPATAAALVALNPELSSHFSVPPTRWRGSEAVRGRTLSLAELIRCVADESPVALLLDDTHWMDRDSRQLLTGMLGRLRDAPALVVTAGRPHPEARIIGSDTVEMTLGRLTAEDVQAMLASLGALPDESWADTLPRQLHEATAGSPLLVLETLQFALDEALLVRHHDGWRCPDPDGLGAHLDSGDALRHRVSTLPIDDRNLLLVLASAGTPLDTAQVAETTSRETQEVEGALFRMEQRGLVARTAAGWEPAHDEIAAIVQQRVAPESLQAAHRALGIAYLRRGHDDPAMLARAGIHLREGGPSVLLHQGFTRWVLAVRRDGDRSPLRELATEYAGADADDRLRNTLVRRLPLRIRLGLTSPSRVAAVGVLVAALALGGPLFKSTDPPPPDAVLFAFEPRDDSTLAAASVFLNRDRWIPGERLPRRTHGRFPLYLSSLGYAAAMRPGHSGFVHPFTFSDSGGIDLVLATAEGRRRLTFAPGDDDEPHWSPDGSHVVFKTARWNEMSWYDLAVLDVATGAVRPLLRHPHIAYYGPTWSPDGTRIAFHATMRGPVDAAADSVCVVTIDGLNTQCHPARGIESSPSYWLDGTRLLVSTLATGPRMLSAFDVREGTLHPLGIEAPPGTDFVLLSPDGQWVANRVPEPNTKAINWLLAPLDRPDLIRRIELPEGGLVGWGLSEQLRGRYLDSLEIVPVPRSIPLTAPFRPEARGADTHGRSMSSFPLAWSTLDSSIAAIDSAGDVWPKRPGRATLAVSAGGWRQDTAVVTIADPEWRELLVESWGEGYPERWRTYGIPEPGATLGADSVRAFWNTGDEQFFSGAYTRDEFTPDGGLGIEVLLSIRLTEPQWQALLVELMPSPDSAELARWDHQTEYAPGSIRPSPGGCAMMYARPDTLRFPNETNALGPTNTNGSGEWFRLTLQIFPDGTCGLAVDGEPLARSTARTPLDRPYRVYLEGQSWRTRALHGPLQVWQGVRPNIDWRVLRGRPTISPDR